MTQQNETKDKVVDLAEARKRQRTIQDRPKPFQKDQRGGFTRKLLNPTQGTKKSWKQLGLQEKVVAVVQLLAFLAVCFFMLKTCGA